MSEIIPAWQAEGQAAGKWTKGIVLLGQATDFPMLRIASTDESSDGPPGGQHGLLAAGVLPVGPALLIGGDAPEMAARTLATRWRPLAKASSLSVRSLETAPPSDSLSFRQIDADLGIADLVDRRTFNAGFSMKDMPVRRYPTGARIDLGVPSDVQATNAAVAVFLNDHMLASQALDAGPRRPRRGVPGWAGRTGERSSGS